MKIPRERRQELINVFRERHPGVGMSFREIDDESVEIIAHGSVDLAIIDEVSEFPDPRAIYACACVELDPASEKPIKVKRNACEVWCYASNAMRALLAMGKLAVGDKVLVAFVDGDREKPCVAIG
jgi:hypothetical protein